MRFRAGIGTALVALVLTGLPVATVSAEEERTGGAGNAAERGQERRSERAEAALAAAKDLFTSSRSSGDARSRAQVAPHEESHASLVLRDLAVGVEDLPPRDQELARAILARPTDGAADPWPGVKYDGAPTSTDCVGPGAETRNVCLHWVTNPNHRDAPPAGWVAKNQQVLEEVWQKLVGDLGYRAPESDADSAEPGPDGRLDVYLAELGVTYGLYGYCAPEWDGGSTSTAYCVIDNDFAEYGGKPLEMLQVTAAHELFHTVQLAYTVKAEMWVAEGTAAWIEDEVFDDVNDNLQYLSHSPLSRPRSPLDTAPNYQWVYGSWIFWRFLTEYFAEAGSTSPDVVRDVWERMGRGHAVLPAVRGSVSARGAAFPAVFAAFGALNRVAPLWYDEGYSYAPFVAPVLRSDRFLLTPAKRATTWQKRSLARLSNRHMIFQPGRTMTGAWKVRLLLDLPPTRRGSRATLMVHRRTGSVIPRTVRLNRFGDATVSAPFNRNQIAYVALSLTNANGDRPGSYRVKARALR